MTSPLSTFAALIVATAFAASTSHAQTSLSTAESRLEALFSNTAVWNMKPDDFMTAAKDIRFSWTSDTKGSARCTEPGLTFLQKDILETVVMFKDEKIDNVMMSIYNKGDTAVINTDKYETIVTELMDRLSQRTGMRAQTVSSKRATSVNLKKETLFWPTKTGFAFVLEHASSNTKNPQTRRIEEIPEYINVTMLKGGPLEVSALTGDQKVNVNLVTLKQKIKTETNGDVYLADIPMVHQGEKGYCANATTERVLRYYGVQVNQHRLAQQARTAAGGGTSAAELLEALKAMAGMMYLRVNEMITTDVSDLIAMIKDYNREAKKQNKPQISLPSGGVIDMGAVMRSMQTDVFVASRTTNPSQIAQFEKNVKSKIDRGIPLIWSVTLGFVSEEPAIPQAFGGHMRLIIGYNSKTHEIIYTDSWGTGHEFKHMQVANANAITKGLFSLEPMI